MSLPEHGMTHKSFARNTRLRGRSARGFALLEVLIAILIFAFGILGLIGLQSAMTRAQTVAAFRGDASSLSSELLGIIWTDIANIAKYDTASGNCDGYARCLVWKNKVASTLAGATPIVAADATGQVTITIRWTVPGEDAHQFVTSSNVQAVQ